MVSRILPILVLLLALAGCNCSTSFGTPSSPASSAAPIASGPAVTVAIVDAQDDPSAEADLAVYRSTFGLPPCTTANGCFKKVNQRGAAGSYPTADSGWAGEISLDLDAVSAMCPTCNILLVEADSSAIEDLGAGVNLAVSMGAKIVSNSYGGPEDPSVVASDAAYYAHPGVSIVVSSGDSGYGVEYPASSAHVIAAGGTTLTQDTSPRGWTEKAWSGGGSGCSGYIAKPSWQKDTGCNMRVEADVSADADPDSGLAVYCSYGADPGNAWVVVGGTSAAAPIVASVIAATGRAGVDASVFYSTPAQWTDVVLGANDQAGDGSGCGGTYLCLAGPGYDAPTGWGTPIGALLAGKAVAPAREVQAASRRHNHHRKARRWMARQPGHYATSYAYVEVGDDNKPLRRAVPDGITPAELRDAYLRGL